MKPLLFLAFCFGFLIPSQAQVNSSFVSHSERWTIIPGQVNAKHQAGGPTNGYIFSTDFLVQNQAVNWYFTAPAKYTGNLSAYFKGVLAFRLRQFRNNGKQLAGFYDVVIIGNNGQALVYKLPNLPNMTWTPYRLGLRPDDPNWRMIPAGQVAVNSSKNPFYNPSWPKPNARQFYAVLSNVKSMHIRGEYLVGDDGCALDEVYLGKPNF